ncbi:prophage Clp protease-like protein [Cellulophaga phage phi46:1]|uniref:prophage Clp protease-like protein n=1 Tax=Cellulophaga phage phi46:1 TaxID=1327974 RepID=UPI00035182BE|nr:prophage Clp protease-like protein [Cellulophaga phage phi46:1]AGO47812.1 prophage Clp protease-like protein [Cellulophaga phage phi46:1]
MSKPKIKIMGVIGQDVTLASVISDVKAHKDLKELTVVVNTVGGSVVVGKSIHDYLKALNVPLTTIAEKAYSIGAHIFMAGDADKRLIAAGVEKPLMIHLPLVQGVSGNSAVLDDVSAMLKKINKEFSAFYSGLLSIDEAAVTALLENETFISADEAVKMGFASGVAEEISPIAFYDEQKPAKNDSEEDKRDPLLIAIAKKLGIIKPEIKALQLLTADNETLLDFFELEEGQTPAVEDKARINGSEADGSIVMPTGETFIFEKGVLKTIEPKEESEDGDEGEPAPAPSENEALQAQIIDKLMKANEALTEKVEALAQTLSPDPDESKGKKKVVKPYAEMTALERRRYAREIE